MVACTQHYIAFERLRRALTAAFGQPLSLLTQNRELAAATEGAVDRELTFKKIFKKKFKKVCAVSGLISACMRARHCRCGTVVRRNWLLSGVAFRPLPAALNLNSAEVG